MDQNYSVHLFVEEIVSHFQWKGIFLNSFLGTTSSPPLFSSNSLTLFITNFTSLIKDQETYEQIFIFLLSFVTQIFESVLGFVYNHFFIRPLALFYLSGPRLNGFGMWAGTEPADICAQLTHLPSKHWMMDIDHRDLCKEIIFKDFTSVYVTVQTITFILLLYKLLNYIWYKYFIYPLEVKKETRMIEVQFALLNVHFQQQLQKIQSNDSCGSEKHRD